MPDYSWLDTELAQEQARRANLPGAIPGAPSPAPSPSAPPDRGWLADLGASAARGVYGVGETGAKAYEGVGRAAKDFAGIDLPGTQGAGELADSIGKSRDEAFPLSKAASEPGARNVVSQGVESAATSLTPALAGAAIGSAFGPVGTVTGGLIGLFSGVPTFAAAQYADTMKEAEKRGVDPETAKWTALVNAASEGGTELLSDVVAAATGGTGKVLTTVGKDALKAGISPLLKQGWKPMLANMGKVFGAEASTELLNSGIQAEANKAAGIDTKGFWDAVAENAGPVGVASLIFSTIGGGMTYAGRRRIENALTNPEVHPAEREAAVKAVAGHLDGIDPDAARVWNQSATETVAKGEAVPLDEDFIGKDAKRQEKAQASEMVAAAPQPEANPLQETLSAAGLADKPEWQQALATFDAITGGQEAMRGAMGETAPRPVEQGVTAEALGPAMEQAWYEPGQVDAGYQKRLEQARQAGAEPFPATMGDVLGEPAAGMTPEPEPAAIPEPRQLSAVEQKQATDLQRRIDNLDSLLLYEKNIPARTKIEETKRDYVFQLRDLTGVNAPVMTPEEQARSLAVSTGVDPQAQALPAGGQDFELVGGAIPRPPVSDAEAASMEPFAREPLPAEAPPTETPPVEDMDALTAGKDMTEADAVRAYQERAQREGGSTLSTLWQFLRGRLSPQSVKDTYGSQAYEDLRRKAPAYIWNKDGMAYDRLEQEARSQGILTPDADMVDTLIGNVTAREQAARDRVSGVGETFDRLPVEPAPGNPEREGMQPLNSDGTVRDGQEPMYLRESPKKESADRPALSPEASQAIVDTIREKFPEANLTLARTPRELHPFTRMAIVHGDASAVYIDGKSFVYGPKMRTEAGVLAAGMHELSHQGIDNLRNVAAERLGSGVAAGQQAVNNVLDQAWMGRAKEIRELVKPGGGYEGKFDLTKPEGRRKLTEEWMAGQAENTNHRWYDRYVAAMTRFFRSVADGLGIQVKWTDTETRDFLQQAFDTMRAKPERSMVGGLEPAYRQGEGMYRRETAKETADQPAPDPSDRNGFGTWLHDTSNALRFSIGQAVKGQNDASTLGKIFRTAEYWKHPALQKLFNITQNRTERAHELLHDFLDVGDGRTIQDAAKPVLADKQQHDILNRGVDYADVNEVKPEAMEQWFRDNGATNETIGLWRAMREKYDTMLEARLAPLRELSEKGGIKSDVTITLPDGTKKDFSLKQMVEEMGQLRGFYAPRLREVGDWVVSGQRTGEDGKVERFRAHKEYAYGAEKLRQQMAREGWDMEGVRKNQKLPESTQQAIKIMETAKAIEAALGDMKGDESLAGQRVEFTTELLQNMADEIKSRGFRSASIRRAGRNGEVVKGYIDDAMDRFGRYTTNTAFGMAKMDAAREAMAAIMGRYENGQVVGGIDAKAEPEIYKLAQDYYKDQFRNAEKADRMVDVAKSVATLKYLGFNPKSALVNVSSMFTNVPAALHAYAMEGKGSMAKVFPALASASKDYISVMGGKKLANADEQAFVDEIHRKNLDDPQYARDASKTMQDSTGAAWGKTMGAAMWMFGKTEQFNRGATMLAAYRLARERGLDHASAMESAEHTSDRAHGVYGKGTLPTWAWGSGVGARVGQSLYLYQKYVHNYFQMLHEMLGAKQYKAFAYATAAPMVLAGATGQILPAAGMAVLGGMMKAMGDDRDPEKFVYDTIRERLGGKAEEIARYGVLGSMGMNLSGSMNTMVDIPGGNGLMDLLGPAGGVIRDVKDAVGYVGTGEYSKAAEKALPTGLAKPIQALRETGGVTTKQGFPVLDESGKQYVPTAGDAALKMAGVLPARESALKARTYDSRREEASFNERRSKLYQEVRAFSSSKDQSQEAKQKIAADISDFNADAAKTGNTAITPITLRSIQGQFVKMNVPGKKNLARLQSPDPDEAEAFTSGMVEEASHPFNIMAAETRRLKAEERDLTKAGQYAEAHKLKMDNNLYRKGNLIANVDRLKAQRKKIADNPRLDDAERAQRVSNFDQRIKEAMDRAVAVAGGT